MVETYKMNNFLVILVNKMVVNSKKVSKIRQNRLDRLENF